MSSETLWCPVPFVPMESTSNGSGANQPSPTPPPLIVSALDTWAKVVHPKPRNVIPTPSAACLVKSIPSTAKFPSYHLQVAPGKDTFTNSPAINKK